MTNDAEFISKTFKKAFTLFGNCHSIYDSSKALSQTDINDLGIQNTQFYIAVTVVLLLLDSHITKFLEYYRDSFPHASILPKMHLLEDHLVPFLKEYGVGLGFLGEQGAESIHARFNQIQRNFSSMPNSAQRLECVMKEHFQQICPQNLSKQPQPKHYVTKRMRNSL